MKHYYFKVAGKQDSSCIMVLYVTLVAKKESKKWTVADVGNHSREKETCRDTGAERGRGGKGRRRNRHRQRERH